MNEELNHLKIERQPWWGRIDADLQELLHQSFDLYRKVLLWEERYQDYAFVVFPAAKAYEGILKKLFYDCGFITKDDYLGKHFRLGRALNPSLDRTHLPANDPDVYNRVVRNCGGEELAINLWDTWKNCRNLLFHWFPEERNAVDLQEAKERILTILNTISLAYGQCNIIKR